MKLLHGRWELRSMPSRHHFAIFRLISYMRVRSIRIEGEPDCVLSINRDQSAVELFGVSLWITLTFGICGAGVLTACTRLTIPVALVIAIPLAWFGVQMMMVFCGAAIAPLLRLLARRPGENNIALNSFVVMLLLSAGACWMASQPTWARFAAIQFLTLLALNGVAAVVVFMLRSDIDRLEQSLGGTPSESSSSVLR
jgi:hypothetical protein